MECLNLEIVSRFTLTREAFETSNHPVPHLVARRAPLSDVGGNRSFGPRSFVVAFCFAVWRLARSRRTFDYSCVYIKWLSSVYKILNLLRFVITSECNYVGVYELNL